MATGSLDKFDCASAIEASLIVFGLRKFLLTLQQFSKSTVTKPTKTKK